MQQDLASLDPDALVRRTAGRHGPADALLDAPNRAILGLGPVRRLSWSEVDTAVEALALRFVRNGLGPGDTIALQLPNIVEQHLTILAAWRAGLRVCALPLLWRHRELTRVLAELRPRALVTFACDLDYDYADGMRSAAADVFSVRYVYGFGDDLLDGITGLSDVFAGDVFEGIETAAGQEPAVLPKRPPASTPALISWTTLPQAGPRPILRSYREVVTLGAMVALAVGLRARDTMLSPYPASSLAGLGAGLAAWLVSGSALVLHLPLDYATLIEQIACHGVTFLLAPEPVLQALNEDGLLDPHGSGISRAACVWPAPYLSYLDATARAATIPVFDLHNLSDLTLVAQRRQPNDLPGRLPLGPSRVPDRPDGAVFLETRVRGSVRSENGGPAVLRGELLVRGPTVPMALREGPDAYVSTGLLCTVDDTALRCDRANGLFYHGGIAIDPAELDDLYAAYPHAADAAAFAITDATMGERIYAAVVPRPEGTLDLDSFQQFLMRHGVAPYKFPDRLVQVEAIPRDGDGMVLRDRILPYH